MKADFQILIGIAQSEQRCITVKADFHILIAFAPSMQETTFSFLFEPSKAAWRIHMTKWLDNLFEKNELTFALVWIGIYCALNSLANPLSEAIGIHSSASLICNSLLTVMLFLWLRKKGLTKYYGLCRPHSPAGRFLWYLPLLLFMSHNLWFGIAVNYPAADTACYILSMLCVGFLEEVIFRGFLFKALTKENVKTAVLRSSVTFGLGHILNLFNGSGMDITANLWQIVSAIACGFLFVVIFYGGGSLLPCIAAHSVNNAVSVFANEAALTAEKRILFSAVNFLLVAAYAFVLTKTLPKQQSPNPKT